MKNPKKILLMLAVILFAVSGMSEPVYAYYASGAVKPDLYRYRVENGYAVIYGCDRYASTYLSIPETLDGYEVREIEEGAFRGYQADTVIIPKTVVRIGKQAFYGMKRLTMVTIQEPDSSEVQQIGAQAFASCPCLSAMALSDHVTSIAGDAFDGCADEVLIRTEDTAAYVKSYAGKHGFMVSTEKVLGDVQDLTAVGDANDIIYLHWRSEPLADRYQILLGDDDFSSCGTVIGETTENYFALSYYYKDLCFGLSILPQGTYYGGEAVSAKYDPSDDYFACEPAFIGGNVYEDASIKTAEAESCTSVKLTWSPFYESEQMSRESERYKLYMKKGDSWELIQEPDEFTTSAVVDGLEFGETYTFALQRIVVTKGLVSRSDYTKNTVTVKVRPPAPKITSLKKASPSSVKVTWNKVDGATRYVVYRSDLKSGAYKRLKIIKDSDVTSYMDTGLKKGITYYYKVVAIRDVSGKAAKSKPSVIKAKKV